MKATTIINSISRALGCTFDRDAAIKRLHGVVNGAGNKTLRIKKDRKTYSFYAFDGKKAKYLSKTAPELYRLARKRYCIALIALLEASNEDQAQALEKVATLLNKYESGHLELAHIVFSTKQYNWYTSNYAKKPQPETGHQLGDELVRSKSEQDIGLSLIELGIPFHFEERLEVYVRPIVEELEAKIYKEAFGNWTPSRKLFYYKNGTCYWNVPPILEWMNASGSIWKTYNYKTGKITIYPDFKIMLADATNKIWEHEGLTNDFVYRNNASERVTILKSTRAVTANNLIETFEYDTDDKQRIMDIIASRILPGVWW